MPKTFLRKPHITSIRYAIDGVLFDTCSNGIAAIETILEYMRSHGRSNILGKCVALDQKRGSISQREI